MFTSRNHNIRLLVNIYGISVILICFFVLYLCSSSSRGTVPVLQKWKEPLTNDLFNLTDFHYVLESGRCRSEAYAILLVTSYAGDVESRSAIRQAYSSNVLKSIGIQRVFLLGIINPHRNLNNIEQAALVNEHERFGDLLQGSFYEDYRNLTYKHMMGLRWAAQACQSVRYIIKMDSDIVVNFYSVVEMLKKLPERDFILAGYALTNMKPMRDPANKWFVTSKEYHRDWYPDFLSGWLYFTNPKTAQLLCDAMIQVPYFWIDDTYVTGLLREKLNISLARLNKYYTTHPEHLKCCLQQPKFDCDYWVGPNGGETKLIVKFEKFAEKCYKEGCKRRTKQTSVRNNCIVKWSDDHFGKGII